MKKQKSGVWPVGSFDAASLARILHFVSSEGSSSSLDEVNDSLELMLQFKGKKAYLPLTNADRLLYLVHLPRNESWLPMTREQEVAFKEATRAEAVTSLWFRYSIALPAMFIISCLAFSSLAPFPSSYTDKQALIGICVMGNIGAFMANLFSWVVTGTNPHASSTAANKRQNAVRMLKEAFDELAYELIDLAKVDAGACQLLVSRVDAADLRARMQHVGVAEDSAVLILRHFEAVLRWATLGVLPSQHLLAAYIASDEGAYQYPLPQAPSSPRAEYDADVSSPEPVSPNSASSPTAGSRARGGSQTRGSRRMSVWAKTGAKRVEMASVVRMWLDEDAGQLKELRVKRVEAPVRKKAIMDGVMFKPAEHSLGGL